MSSASVRPSGNVPTSRAAATRPVSTGAGEAKAGAATSAAVARAAALMTVVFMAVSRGLWTCSVDGEGSAQVRPNLLPNFSVYEPDGTDRRGDGRGGGAAGARWAPAPRFERRRARWRGVRRALPHPFRPAVGLRELARGRPRRGRRHRTRGVHPTARTLARGSGPARLAVLRRDQPHARSLAHADARPGPVPTSRIRPDREHFCA